MLPVQITDSRGVTHGPSVEPFSGRADLHAHGWGSTENICLRVGPFTGRLLDHFIGCLLTGRFADKGSELFKILDTDNPDVSITLHDGTTQLSDTSPIAAMIGRPKTDRGASTFYFRYKPPLKPEIQYRQAKEKGMTLVAFTDHESIAAAWQFMRRHPQNDCILGVELPVFLHPARLGHNFFHINVLGLSPDHFADLTHGWEDLADGDCLLFQPDRLFAYLEDHNLFFFLNHLTFLQRPDAVFIEDLLWLIKHPSIRFFELNAAWGRQLAELTMKYVHTYRPQKLFTRFIAGSDSHYNQIGTSFVSAPEDSPQGFLDCLRGGNYMNHIRYWEPGDFAREVQATFDGGLRLIIAALYRQGLVDSDHLPRYSMRNILTRIIYGYMHRTVVQLLRTQYQQWETFESALQKRAQERHPLMPVKSLACCE